MDCVGNRRGAGRDTAFDEKLLVVTEQGNVTIFFCGIFSTVCRRATIHWGVSNNLFLL